jgi:hypothetical protein
MMDHALIYGYICIGLVGISLIGMIIFTGVVLRKLRRVPRRCVYSDDLIPSDPDGVPSVMSIV